MSFQTTKFQLIEIAIPAAPAIGLGSSQPFLDQDQLQTYVGGQVIFIQGIEIFYDQEIPVSPITTTNIVATAADCQKAVLVLVSKGTENFKYIPLAKLHCLRADTSANHLANAYEMFQPKDLFAVDWTKSFLRFVGTLSAQPMSFLFGIHYSYVNLRQNTN